MSVSGAQAVLLARDPSVQAVSVAAEELQPVTNTAATWTSGQYLYDGSGNIKAFGMRVFAYDVNGRLTKDQTSTDEHQGYSYDAFGNILTVKTAEVVNGWPQITESRPAVDPVTNQIDNLDNTKDFNVVGAYDAAGNMTSLNASSHFVYDALNMVTEATVDGVTRVFIYTASDERITATTMNGSAVASTQWTLRDASGKVLRRLSQSASGEWTWQEDYIYRGSQLLAAEVAAPEKIRHFHLDHLGTPRLITGNGGVVIAEPRYFAFGQEVRSTADGEPMKFTGHERDARSLDYMHARYYGPLVGRFLSADPSMDLKANVPNPQRWNRYSYVSNNPINKVDPDGRDEYALIENAPRTQAELQQLAAFNRKWLPVALIPAGGAALSTLARAAFTAFPRLFVAAMSAGAGMTGGATGPAVNLGSGARPIAGAINVDNLSPGFRGSMQQVQVAADALSLPFKNGSIGNVTAQNLPSVLLGQGGQQLAGELGRTMQSGSTLSISTQTPGALAHFAKLLGRHFDDVRIEGNRLTAVRQ